MLSSFQKDMLKKLVVQNAKNPDALIGIFIEKDALIDEEALKLKLKPLEEGALSEQTTRVSNTSEALEINQRLLEQLRNQFNDDYPA